MRPAGSAAGYFGARCRAARGRRPSVRAVGERGGDRRRGRLLGRGWQAAGRGRDRALWLHRLLGRQRRPQHVDRVCRDRGGGVVPHTDGGELLGGRVLCASGAAASQKKQGLIRGHFVHSGASGGAAAHGVFGVQTRAAGVLRRAADGGGRQRGGGDDRALALAQGDRSTATRLGEGREGVGCCIAQTPGGSGELGGRGAGHCARDAEATAAAVCA